MKKIFLSIFLLLFLLPSLASAATVSCCSCTGNPSWPYNVPAGLYEPEGIFEKNCVTTGENGKGTCTTIPGQSCTDLKKLCAELEKKMGCCVTKGGTEQQNALQCVDFLPEKNEICTQKSGNCTGTFYSNKCSEVAGCAAGTEEVIINPPKLQIPEFDQSLIKLSENIKITDGSDGKKYIEIPWIGEFIRYVYNYAIGVAGILAAVMIMVGGVIWVVSAGDAGRVTTAKQYITSSVIGLVILFTSYIILKTISPALIVFAPVRIEFIENIPIPDMELGTSEDYGLISAPSGGSNLVSIKDTPGASIGCIDPNVQEKVANGFKAAVKIMQSKGFTVSLGSLGCHRTATNQPTGSLACQCKIDGCLNCPHVAGIALDVFCTQEKVSYDAMKQSGAQCKGNSGCKSKPATRSDYNCQNVLIDAMRQSGMCKLYFEDWHFQPKGTSTSRCF